ncbi:MAG TPA: hypothetical protein VMV77_21200 [Bacteroidales bacterium]|nr:hypothetical protein [Bacteroidales bacterium]
MRQTTFISKNINLKLCGCFKMLRIGFLLFYFSIALAGRGFSQLANNYYDFSNAEIVIPDNLTETEQAAVQMLVDEVKKRTIIKLSTNLKWPDSNIPVIAIGTSASFNDDFAFDKSIIKSSDKGTEGFSIKVINEFRNSPTLFIIGNDSRGMLFGIGYFLRKVSMIPSTNKSSADGYFEEWSASRRIGMIPGQLMVPDDIGIENSYPAVSIRGHQLGYRPKVNAYDGFTVEMYEQYIRDLIVFGTNAVELIPPNSDDDSYSPMFSLPPWEMNIKISKILEKYGLDSWIWCPLMYGDYSKSENFKKSLEENEKLFSSLKKIDAVFVPGGDPGNVPPKLLFDYLEKEAQILHKYHPTAEIWVSPQGFSVERMEEFLNLLKGEHKWLTGIVHGPWVRMNVDSLRKVVPMKYRIRRYPDITHSIQCEYPVPNWDIAFASTQHREVINPRPIGQSIIFHSVDQKSSAGFLTYSEGVNDDVNKIVWSGLGWNPDTEVLEILRDYSRYFIGPDYTDDFAQGILNLEQNWVGPLLSNNSVFINHGKFQSMEKRALPNVRLNWRFQQALYRSYYDAYNRSRLIYETQLEDAAMNFLRKAPELGTMTAMKQAKEILDKAKLERVSEDWRQRVFELAEALFHSIRMQLSVDKYFAIAVGRGANLDLIDQPLNNSIWLEDQFNLITKLDTEEERLTQIDKIINWENPGPGGFYTDFGDLSNNPYLVPGESYKDDPGSWHSPFIGWRTGTPQTQGWRISWKRYVHTLFNTPLKMHYSNLDRKAQYQVKITYLRGPVQLVADEKIIIHDYFEMESWVIETRTYDIPHEATADGELMLTWNMDAERGGNGRGNKIGEMWLIKIRN